MPTAAVSSRWSPSWPRPDAAPFLSPTSAKAGACAREAVIYVLNGVLPNTGRALADAYLRPVINSTTELAEWDTFVATNDWRGGAALHIDTGMNRLGLTVDEGVAISSRIKSESHGFTLLM